MQQNFCSSFCTRPSTSIPNVCTDRGSSRTPSLCSSASKVCCALAAPYSGEPAAALRSTTCSRRPSSHRSPLLSNSKGTLRGPPAARSAAHVAARLCTLRPMYRSCRRTSYT